MAKLIVNNAPTAALKLEFEALCDGILERERQLEEATIAAIGVGYSTAMEDAARVVSDNETHEDILSAMLALTLNVDERSRRIFTDEAPMRETMTRLVLLKWPGDLPQA